MTLPVTKWNSAEEGEPTNTGQLSLVTDSGLQLVTLSGVSLTTDITTITPIPFSVWNFINEILDELQAETGDNILAESGDPIELEDSGELNVWRGGGEYATVGVSALTTLTGLSLTSLAGVGIGTLTESFTPEPDTAWVEDDSR